MAGTDDKLNCWEVKKCGREPGGAKVEEFGVCAAALAQPLDGVHDGRGGGRACWVVSGTLCGGEIQGTFAAKNHNCMACEFYAQVMKEERGHFLSSRKLLAKLE